MSPSDLSTIRSVTVAPWLLIPFIFLMANLTPSIIGWGFSFTILLHVPVLFSALEILPRITDPEHARNAYRAPHKILSVPV